MTDIVEQAARVLAENWQNMHTNESLGKQQMLAQALADAGLLRDGPIFPINDDPEMWEKYRQACEDVYETAAQRIGTGETWTVDAREALGMQRTVPARLITDVQDLEMTLDRVVIRDADGDIYERQGELTTERGTFAAWLGTHNGIKPSPDIRLPATVIYIPGEFTGRGPTKQEVWQEAFSAGYMDGQSHTTPTRNEIAEALREAIDNPRKATWDMDLDAADAVLALMADQPTVEDVRDQAVAEDRLRRDSGARIPLEELQIRDGK